MFCCRDFRRTASLGFEGNSGVELPMAESPSTISVSPNTNAPAANILRTEAGDDTPPAIKTESCGLIVGGFPRRLEKRQGKGDRHAAEDPSIVFSTPANIASDAGNGLLYETTELSPIHVVESPGGVSPVNVRGPPRGMSFDERYSPHSQRSFWQEHAWHGKNSGICTGLASAQSRKSPINCALAMGSSSGSYPVGITKNRLKDGTEERMNCRQTRRDGDSSAEWTHIASAVTVGNKSIMNGNDCNYGDIVSNSYCAKGTSVAGWFALAMVAVTAFAAGTICGPSLRRQVPPVSTPQAYIRHANDVTNIVSREDRKPAFRWQRSPKLAAAVVPTRGKGQRSFTTDLAPSGCGAMTKDERNRHSPDARGRGGRGTSMTEESGSLEGHNRAACGKMENSAAVPKLGCAVGRILLWPEKTTGNQQASNRYVHNVSWKWRQPLLSRPRDVTSVDECVQEGKGFPKVLPRISIVSRTQTGVQSCRYDACRTLVDTEGRDYINGEDEVEIKAPAKLFAGEPVAYGGLL